MRFTSGVKWHFILPLAVFSVLLFAVGCGNNSAPLDYLYGNPEAGKLPQFLEKPADATEVSQYIAADTGGEIEFDCDGGLHRFVVVAGSMPASQTIDISAWTKLYQGSKVLRLNFGPSGLEFDPSSQLSVEVVPLWGNESSLKLYWYDPQEEEWELEEVAAVDVNGMATFYVEHFSKYAISR